MARILLKGYIGKLVLEYCFIDYEPEWWWWIEFADISRN